MSARIGDLVKLDGPTLIALRGIIAVRRHLNAIDDEPTQIILEGGATILVTQLEGEFVRKEWEFWSTSEAQLTKADLSSKKTAHELPCRKRGCLAPRNAAGRCVLHFEEEAGTE